MTVYYNEWDPYCAAWMRQLMAAGQLPAGTVDTRDMRALAAADLAPYTSCHFFAGLGGWPYALTLAGWPATRPVWTASLPCQPFSAAGQRWGALDARDLWPAFFGLVRECRPGVIVGEQVAAALGFGWWDRVCRDLEGEGYACGAVVLGAHSVGAPHRRQRLYWVAHSRQPAEGRGLSGWEQDIGAAEKRAPDQSERPSTTDRLPHAECAQRRPLDSPCADARADSLSRGQESTGGAGGYSQDGGMGFPRQPGLAGWPGEPGHHATQQPSLERAGDDAGGMGHALSDGAQWAGRGQCEPDAAGTPGGMGHARQYGTTHGDAPPEPGGERTHDRVSREANAWDDYALLPCRDGKARRVKPGVCVLAHGIPRRLDQLRAFGNAIVPQAAAMFLRAYLDSEAEYHALE